MQNRGRVHRFREHAVAGVNWRPTRFVDEVPSLRVCDFCRMIPKRIVVLPCSHTLCQLCYVANSGAAGGRCPLDEKLFDEAECATYELPTRAAMSMKVHCWNEAHGCQFESAVEEMLRHYENERTFHTVECLRCGEEVLHRELKTHYVAGCSAAASSAGTEDTSSESRALTLQDVTAALEELKTLLRDANHEQLLLAIQSQMNELTEQTRNQESRSAVITQAVPVPAAQEIAQVAAPSPSTSLQEGTSRQNPNREASTPSTSRSQLERTLLDLPLELLGDQNRTSSQDFPRHAITRIYRDVECRLVFSRWSPLTIRREVLCYVLKLANLPSDRRLQAPNFASITVWHTKDAYFTVDVYSTKSYPFDISLRITFHGTRGDSRCPPPVFVVRAYVSSGQLISMSDYEEDFDCHHDRDSWAHRRHVYNINYARALHLGILREGVTFEIEVCCR